MRVARTLLLAIGWASLGVTASRAGTTPFERGDADASGSVDIGDPVLVLGHLFGGSPASLPCPDAADSNDDGNVDVSDAVRSLGYLFLGDAAPPPPFGTCGDDPSIDELGCPNFERCRPPPDERQPYVVESRYEGECSPTDVILMDLDGDSRLDLVWTAFCAGVVVRLATDHGRFGDATVHPVGFRPQSLAAGDLDGDGRTDLVAVADGRPGGGVGSIGVLLATEDGSYRDVTFWHAYFGARSIALGDLDRDGDLDAVVVGTTRVLILFGDGRGGFPVAATHELAGPSSSVRLGDFDADGSLDIAAAVLGPAGGVSVLLGGRDGTFRAALTSPVPGGLFALSTGDLDGDGALDLLASHGVREGAIVLRGHGDGRFVVDSRCPVGGPRVAIALGDLDRDGVLDAVATDAGSDQIAVLRGRGGGAFSTSEIVSMGTTPWAVALGDLGGDGGLDIVVASRQGNEVAILRAR